MAYRRRRRRRRRQHNNPISSTFHHDTPLVEYTSIKNLNESKNGFWGVVARKARAIIDDDNAAQQAKKHYNFWPSNLDTSNDGQHNFHTSYQPPEGHRKIGSPAVQQRLDALANSLNYIGGKVGNAVEEGISIVESRTANIIQETRKINIRRKGSGLDAQNHGSNILPHQNTVQNQNDQEAQLKASRDVANAMAAKAKLLLRELKTVKADLAFAKERSSQLEEENKMLRERDDNQDQIEDDDLMSLQLESLLAEKARLAQENSTHARENRFLREIVEYHQLTMQDVVYLNEGNEEVTEVYPTLLLPTFSSPATPVSPYPCTLTPQPSIKMASSPQPLPPSSSPSFKTTSLEFSSAQGASSAVPTSESVAEVVSEENTKNTDACSKDLTDGK